LDQCYVYHDKSSKRVGTVGTGLELLRQELQKLGNKVRLRAAASGNGDGGGAGRGRCVCVALFPVVLIPCAQRKSTKDLRSCQSMPTPNSLSPLSIPLSLPIVSSPASSFRVYRLLLVLQLLLFDVLVPTAPSLPLTVPCLDSCIRQSKIASVARRKFGGGCCHNQGEGDRGQCCRRCQGRSNLSCKCGSSVHPSSFLCH
jgi:hypothetical protein